MPFLEGVIKAAVEREYLTARETKPMKKTNLFETEPSCTVELFLVPVDWDQTRDIQYFNGDYESEAETDAERYEVMGEKIAENYAELLAVLERALGYFQHKRPRQWRVPLGALSLDERLDLLWQYLRASSTDVRYLNRFREHLAFCRWADAERHRLLTQSWDDIKRPWLWELMHLNFGLLWASDCVDQDMRCEHDDYNDAVIDE